MLFIREDLYGDTRYGSGRGTKKKKKQEEYLAEVVDRLKYGAIVDEIDPEKTAKKRAKVTKEDTEKLEGMQQKKIVGGDPNMGNLTYFSDEEGNKFRYTQAQRVFETKQEKYSEFQDNLSKTTYVDGHSVKYWEGHLSHFNSKSLDLETYLGYVGARLVVDSIAKEMYQTYQLRKNRLHAYRNRRTSQHKLKKNFQDKFGNPDEVLIAYGYWEQKKLRKFKPPVKGKGMRTLFRQFGYEVYLFWEHRTSCQCFDCKTEEAKNEKFMNVTFTKKGKTRTEKVLGLMD